MEGNQDGDDVLLQPSVTSTIRTSTEQSSASSHLSRYGSPQPLPPRDDAVQYPPDDNHGFFAQGRDFESAFVNHKYTSAERDILATYESLDYLPSHSVVYKNWIKRQPARLEWDRWVMMAFIGVSVGLIGFILHQIIDGIADFKWDKAREYIENEEVMEAWGWVLVYSVSFVIVAALLVVFGRPSAAGSGIPELIGFLNGTVVRHIFNIKTMIVKFLSCACAVGSGLPVGPEGPMIHLGSLVGAGLSQFKSDTLKIKLPFFERFRNSEDRRNFISAGAAAGVASAFGAPVGGLLFSMEEVSSFWNMKLSWQIFFCAMLSTFTTDLFNSAFDKFRYQGDFGMFKADKYIMFQIDHGIAVNLLAFIPSLLLGFVGGVLGSLFTFLNLKLARGRKRLLSRINSKWKQKLIRLGEPIFIMIIMATLSVFLPALFSCTSYTCLADGEVRSDCLSHNSSDLHILEDVEQYTCPDGVILKDIKNYTWTNNTYNEVATLLFGTGENAIHHLFSRNTHYQFGYISLVTVLLCYFLLACWVAGTSISSGLVVPMLLIGGLYGRMLGLAMVDLAGVHINPSSYWAWIDPGAFALVGAASFFGGVSRLTMSLTVIMMEITNDVQFLLPIMASIMMAKWVGDFFTHPLYHATLELKCIPFLDAEPVIVNKSKKVVNPELFCARNVMSHTVTSVTKREYISTLAHHLLSTKHGGFPVTKKMQDGQHIFFGFITRLELMVLLKNTDMFLQTDELLSPNRLDVTHIDYQALTLDKLHNPSSVEDMLQTYVTDPTYQSLLIDLEAYVNQSALSVPDKFSLHRTYILFRTLGLRQLTVVDEENHVVGVITRKDLMGFNMEERLGPAMERTFQYDNHLVELSDQNISQIS